MGMNMDEDVFLNSGAAASGTTYAKEIKFNSDGAVDMSSLTIDEKKLVLHSVERNATAVEEIGKFLSVHSASGLKDVSVEEMRRTIPKLFQYLDDHDFVSCKKVKGLWDKRPDWYPTDVPFMDPNNRKRTKAEAGAQPKKPTKYELLPMLTYLFNACEMKMTRCQTPAASPVSHPSMLPLPMSCDSWSTVLSPRSVQTVDDVDTDTDYVPSPASSCRDHCLPFTDCNSSAAAMNLAEAYRLIVKLPLSEDRQLMMEVHDILKRQNMTMLTAEDLTELKQDISVLLDAASPCQECGSRRNRLLNIKANYDPCSVSAADAHRRKASSSSIVKTETASECERYGSLSIADKRHTSVPVGSEAHVSHLPRELDLMLTDVQEVIDWDSTEICDQSATPTVPRLELKPTVSRAREAQASLGEAQPVGSAAESNTVIMSRDNSSGTSGTSNSIDVTVGRLLSVRPRSADSVNALAEVFARCKQSTGLADYKQHSEPKKHS